MTPRRLGAAGVVLLLCAAANVHGQSGAPRVERGRLASGDDTLDTGELVDSFTFEGAPNQRVTIDLVSPDFDTYLVLIPPKGEQIENDDVDDDDPGHSAIEEDLTQRGTYRVLVTSYEEGETGPYTLRITVAGGAPAATSTRRATASMVYGQTRNDRLERADRLVEDKYVDAYTFDGRAGDRVVVEMESADVDTYLTLIPPDGAEIENDDADGSQDVSRVALTLAATGRYRILASSYDDKETGDYRLTLRRIGAGSAPPAARAGASPRSGGRIYGVFVGISDYEGEDNDLEYTAQDARALQRAMVRGAGMRDDDSTVIVDRAATKANITAAVERAGRQTGPDDLFVFFFSGHGDHARRSTPQAADPDGLDETLSFYDGELTDDEMNQLLSGIRGRVLLVLDSCFSGGFSKDVISSPRRMGLFSSEEDVTSGVADKFRAGGYLAKFMAEAIGDDRADRDRNGEITAIELSQYLHERYRSDVKSSSNTENFVRTNGPETGYQHLVVDRGSIGPFEVLFRQ